MEKSLANLIKKPEIEVSVKQWLKIEKESQRLVFTPDAQKALFELLQFGQKLEELKKRYEETIEKVSQAIVDEGEKYLPGFSGVVGEKITATFSARGLLFGIEDEEKAKPFLKETKRVYVDSKKVAAYREKTGHLPEGIVARARQKKLVLKLNE